MQPADTSWQKDWVLSKGQCFVSSRSFRSVRGGGGQVGSHCDQDKAVKLAIALIPNGDWKEPVKGCGYELAETVYCMKETKKAFRLVIKREIRRQGVFEKEGQYFYHGVVTNWLEEKDTGGSSEVAQSEGAGGQLQ
jgi:hypothetical protein